MLDASSKQTGEKSISARDRSGTHVVPNLLGLFDLEPSMNMTSDAGIQINHAGAAGKTLEDVQGDQGEKFFQGPWEANEEGYQELKMKDLKRIKMLRAHHETICLKLSLSIPYVHSICKGTFLGILWI